MEMDDDDLLIGGGSDDEEEDLIIAKPMVGNGSAGKGIGRAEPGRDTIFFCLIVFH